MVVVHHASVRLVWAKAGHGRAILGSLFELLSEERRQPIRLVTCERGRVERRGGQGPLLPASLSASTILRVHVGHHALDVVGRAESARGNLEHGCACAQPGGVRLLSPPLRRLAQHHPRLQGREP